MEDITLFKVKEELMATVLTALRSFDWHDFNALVESSKADGKEEMWVEIRFTTLCELREITGFKGETGLLWKSEDLSKIEDDKDRATLRNYQTDLEDGEVYIMYLG